MREVGHLSTLNNMYIFWVEYLKVFKILKPLGLAGIYQRLLQNNRWCVILVKKWEFTAKQTEKSKIKSHLLRGNNLTFWWQTFSVLPCAWCKYIHVLKKEVSYYINSVTTCLYFLPHNTFLFQKHRIKLYPGFVFFFSLLSRFFLSLRAYCGHSNQLRHLPALFGLLHIIKNTIIRMDHHLLNHPDWRISQSGSEQHCTTHLSYWIFYFSWVSWYRWDCWVNRNERLMIQ